MIAASLLNRGLQVQQDRPETRERPALREIQVQRVQQVKVDQVQPVLLEQKAIQALQDLPAGVVVEVPVQQVLQV
jgi:hypothetical protein